MPDKKSLRNIRLEIEYNGAKYCGWQVQPAGRKKSIQEVIEKVLGKILSKRVKLIVSGRTDAGVHALAQVANFHTNSKIPLDKLKLALNGLLPRDIKISGIGEARPDFHSRFSSKAKIYRYTILNRTHSSPLMEGKVFFYPHPLNLKLMREEARALLGKHNFSSFQASLGKERNPVKTVKRLVITKNKDFVYIEIEADGFLYNMVRNIAGTLIRIGRGKSEQGCLKKILLLKDRRFSGETLPAHGLCLLKVKY
jgi:tRNA pseudouridine38-40 synthase